MWLCVFFLGAVGGQPEDGQKVPKDELSTINSVPLWEGSQYTVHDKDEAILRGVEYAKAMQDDANFFSYGYDYLMCVQGISHRSMNAIIRHRAADIGRALGRKWKREYVDVPEDSSALDMLHLMYGVYALDRLGVPHPTMKNELVQMMPFNHVEEYLHWHPQKEAPSKQNFPLPKDHPLHAKVNTPYIAWYNALVSTYVADKLGLPIGVNYHDVLQWVTHFRPYKGIDQLDFVNWHDEVYAVTSFLYTSSDYARLRLDPALFPHEYNFVMSNVSSALHDKNADMVGELTDALRIFGVTERTNKKMQQAVDFLMTNQNDNGSWGPVEEGEQEAYHPTCTAIFALSEHQHHGFGPSMPDLHPWFSSLVDALPLKDEM